MTRDLSQTAFVPLPDVGRTDQEIVDGMEEALLQEGEPFSYEPVIVGIDYGSIKDSTVVVQMVQPLKYIVCYFEINEPQR